MEALKLPPVALLGTITYGPPATLAVAEAPALARVTLPTESLPLSPLAVNSEPEKVLTSPKVLLELLAVIVRLAGVTVSCPLA